MIFVRQAGGRMFNGDCSRCLLDAPEAIQGVQFYYDKVFKHGMSPRPGYGPATRFAKRATDLIVSMSISCFITPPTARA